MTKDTEKQLKRIADSLERLLDYVRGDRKGVLTEPGEVRFSPETLNAISRVINEKECKND